MKLKNLAIVSAVALSAAGSAYADAHCTGFYLGLNAGYGFGSSKTKYNDKSDANQNPNHDARIGIEGFDGGLHLGYQHDFGKFVAGLEASGALNHADGSSRSIESVRDRLYVERKHAFGIAAKVGAKLNSWLAYVKLGYERASFRAKYDDPVTAANVISGTKNLNGFLAGVGMETMLTSHVMFGGEYAHTFYGKATASNAINDTVKVDPRYGTFKLRLSYKF